jgi:signal transduction histidine kinase
MKLTSYLNRIFIRVFTIFVVINIFAAAIFLYGHSLNIFSAEKDKLNRLLDKENSYLTYVYLNKEQDKTGTLAIEKINNELNFIQITEFDNHGFFKLSPIVLKFANKNLKTFYPQLIVSSPELLRPLVLLFIYFLLSIGMLLYFSKMIKKKVHLDVAQPLVILDKCLDNGIEGLVDEIKLEQNGIFEIDRIYKNLTKEISRFVELKNRINQNEKYDALNEQAKRFAHDIRSPLEALKSITNNLEKLDSHSKLIINTSINRINGISNDLLDNSRREVSGVRTLCFRLLLEEILNNKESEKNIRFNRVINVDYSKTFIEGHELDIYRALSNLLNNSIECQVYGSERVDIKLDLVNSNLVLELQDFGDGMDANLLNRVLEGGISTKKLGNGIGLSSSKEAFLNMGAGFEVKSNIGCGTTIVIRIDTSICPPWFSDTIVISNPNVAIIDDDLSFHHLYSKKFEKMPLEIAHYNGREMSYSQLSEKAICFIDYDLGRERNGIDIIKEFDLNKTSYLVTSSFMDEDVQNNCLENNIKLIPKQIFNNIKVLNNLSSGSVAKNVLIDDDDLIHLLWSMEASKAGIDLTTFYSIDEFILHRDTFDCNTKFFIDSNLGEGLRGDIESEKIYKLGYKNLVLATGYSVNEIDKPVWIKEIIGKRPSFN